MSQAQKDQLADYFATQPVEVVYLFGSQTTGKTRVGSDIDVGVLFKKGVSQSDRFDLKLEFMNQVGRIADFPDNVDVVDLEQAAIALQYSALASREIILVNDRHRQVEFESKVMSRYFDEAYFIKQNTFYSLGSIARVE